MVPWFVRFYFHTMAVTRDGVAVLPTTSVFSDYRIRPAASRSTPSLLEFVMRLPPHSTTSFAIDFDKAFLTLDEHPADPHRGMDLPAPLASIRSVDCVGYESSVDDSVEMHRIHRSLAAAGQALEWNRQWSADPAQACSGHELGMPDSLLPVIVYAEAPLVSV